MDAFPEEQVEDEEEEGCDFEPLPALSEDEENVSLADVLSLRDSCLTEEDIWAICLECSQSLKSIAHSAIFQTLCITPDTLAFNTNGNVCFMEQISDDPEGTFVPPEIDVTGNTFEAHIFSLGATLKAALEYIMEPGTDSKFSQELHTLLEKMQEESPKERPDIETIISLSKENLKLSSSSDICQCLSAVGRRVLSIESCGTFQDNCDHLWNEKVYERISPYEQNKNYNLRDQSSPEVEDSKVASGGNSSHVYTMNDRNDDIKEIKTNTVHENVCCQHVSTQVTNCKENSNNNNSKCVNLLLDTKPYTSELEEDALKRNDLKKVETFRKLPSEFETDPRTFFPFINHSRPLTRKQYASKPKSLSLINNNENAALEGNLSYCGGNNELGLKAADFQEPNSNLDEFHSSPEVSYQLHKLTYNDKKDFLPYTRTGPETSNNYEPDKSDSGCRILKNHKSWECCGETSARLNENYLLHINRMTTVPRTFNENGCNSSLLSSPVQNHSEMKDYYVEEKPYEGRESEMKNSKQFVFLKHLLTQYGKPLKDHELWALCHECLLTMETYTNYPAYLCLDSVLINHDGSVQFVPPESEGSYDMFYLAPELAEEDYITEKVCIYCIAAILWRAAKYNFPPDHKIVLPRKLKNFLLDMARRKSEDRPSLADAIKTCDSYLLEQSISSKKVLAFLTSSAFQAFKEVDSFNDSMPFDLQSERSSVDENFGFLPMSNESKLIAVKGPVPCQPSLNRKSTILPSAFTSTATHFKPIILHQNIDIKKDTVASTMIQCGMTMESVVPVDGKNSICLDIDSESKMDEDSDLPAVSVTTSGILEQDEQGLEASLQTGPKEPNPSSASSCMAKLPLFSESSCLSQEKCPSSSNSNCTVSSSMAFINNFLLKQDPVTRVLTLVPVQIAISEQIPNKPLHSKTAYSCCPSLHVLLSDSVVNYDADKALQNNSPMNNLRNCETSNVRHECREMKVKVNSLPPTTINKEPQTKYPEKNLFLTFCEESNTDAESNDPLSSHTSQTSGDTSPACSLNLETPLQNNGINEIFLKKVVHLIQEQFVSGSHLKNTVEALAIGKYIYSLKDLKYKTFCNAISEKFCDLFWEEKLLANLYDAANGKTIISASTNETKYCGNTFQSQNKPQNLGDASEETNDADDHPQDNAEREAGSQDTADGIEKDGGEFLQTNECFLSTDLPAENQEQDQVLLNLEGNVCTKAPCLSELCGFCPGWGSAFYGSECFSLEVHHYVRKLGKRKVNDTQDIDAKKAELEQLITMETKNYRKSIKFYQRLLHKERRSKGGEVKTVLPKLKGQLEEMKSKVQFLDLVKKYLQIMSIEKWGIEACNLLTVVNMARSEALGIISSLDCMLLFYNINKTQYRAQCNDHQSQPRNLQAGTPLGLMAYLYSRNAFLEGYVQQFLFTFRYFCSQEDFFQFLLDRIRITLPNSSQESCSLLSKICHRSFAILQTWIEDCYAVDFAVNPDFMSTLEGVINSKVGPLNGYGEWLLSLLGSITSRKQSNISECCQTEKWEGGEETSEIKPLHSHCKKSSKDVLQKSFNWNISKGSETVAPYQRGKHTITSALPKPCYTNETEEFSGFYSKIDGMPYFLTEYTAQQLCHQLTLLEQEIFHKCHPVHFLNSRFLGVSDKSVPLQKAASSEQLPAKAYNLFVENSVQDAYLLQLLKYADNVSNWVAAEIVTSYSSKLQVNLLSKFLFIAKNCYEQRNFATVMQILKGLENLIVRQLPVWKCLPSKISEIMEELKAVEVFLKSDSLCLMEGERFKTSPTIPSAHVLAMHIQQLETGGFTMRNGTYKWTKLRNIAKVVSQVHALQENPYLFSPDHRLQSFLRQRIASFSDVDISALAADNYANFYQIPAEKQSRKIQDTLHRMKAMFQ